MQDPAYRLCNRTHPQHAITLRAQLIVVDHFGQTLDARLQAVFFILLEKEFGIGQSRTHHPLVATNHKAGVCGIDIANDQKLVAQLTRIIEEREVFLIRLHGQNQTLLWHLQERFVKVTHHHGGALHQAGHFLHQRVVEQDRFGFVIAKQKRFHFQTTAQALGLAAQGAHHGAAAFVKAGDHRAIARQGGGVVIGMGDLHRRHSGFKAMALCTVTGLPAQRLHRHHRAAMQRQQAMRRAHKAHGAPAGQVAIAL